MIRAFRFNLALGLVLAATSMLISCSSSSKKEAAKPTPAEQADANMKSGQTQYVNQTQTRVDQLSQFSNQLRGKAAQTPSPQSKKLSNAAEDLDLMLKDATKELVEVRSAAPANWIDEKRDVDAAMSRAESHYSNAISLLR